MGGAGFPARAAHAGGEVLKMADGISQEAVAATSGVFQYPFQGGVRPRPFPEDGFIVHEIGGKGFVQLQEGLRGFSLKPMALGETEGIEIKGRTAIRTVALGFSGIIFREMGAVFHCIKGTPQSTMNPDRKILSPLKPGTRESDPRLSAFI